MLLGRDSSTTLHILRRMHHVRFVPIEIQGSRLMYLMTHGITLSLPLMPHKDPQLVPSKGELKSLLPPQTHIGGG